jgi:hypothetical protein
MNGLPLTQSLQKLIVVVRFSRNWARTNVWEGQAVKKGRQLESPLYNLCMSPI